MTKNINGDISLALGVSQWVIVPIAAIVFIGIIYLANRVDDFKKNF
jgi:hypothetical protein